MTATQFVPGTECPWCGEDQAPIMAAEEISYDQAMEGHVPDCEPWLREVEGLES